MGLDISHDTWHGAYSAFNSWRTEIERVAGLPPLELMDGFYNEDDGLSPFDLFAPLTLGMNKDDWRLSRLNSLRERLPIKWDCLKPSPLHELLYHSDCDGTIKYKAASLIADELEKLLPLLSKEEVGGHIKSYYIATETFIKGCRLAASKKQNLKFG